MSSKKRNTDELNSIEDAILESILTADPADLRAERTNAGEEPAVVAASQREIIAKASRTAAKDRMKRAQAEVVAFRSAPTSPIASLPDPVELPTTLAARKGNGLSANEKEVLKHAMGKLQALKDKDSE